MNGYKVSEKGLERILMKQTFIVKETTASFKMLETGGFL